MMDHDDYCLKHYQNGFRLDLLKGKVAFVTGGGSGIGFRISELLMRHGCDIIIASRKLDKLEEVHVIHQNSFHQDNPFIHIFIIITSLFLLIRCVRLRADLTYYSCTVALIR
jgi:NAD(P)-dependent dehydrogenase (short-subunit alcohol dehydrogenase family)